MLSLAFILGLLALGYSECRVVTKREVENFPQLKARLCNGLNALGEDAYHAHCVVYYTKKINNVSLDHVRELSTHCLRIAHKCCADGAADDCLQTEMASVQDQVCARMDEAASVPSVAKCCAQSGLDRHNCFHHPAEEDGPQGVGHQPPPPPTYDGEVVCGEHANHNARLYDGLLWEFSRRYPSAAVSMIVSLAGDFITGITTCCLVEQEHEPCLVALNEEFKHKLTESAEKSRNMCEALKSLGKEKFEDRMIVKFTQKAPHASFDQIQKLADRFELLAEKCCAPGHKESCFVEERYSIDDEICSDPTVLPQSAPLTACCKLAGGPRALCLERITPHGDKASSPLPTLPTEEQCKLLAEKSEAFHNRVVWQVSHRYPTAAEGQVQALARHYITHLAACCLTEHKDTCMAEEVAEFTKEVAKVHDKAAWWCKMTKALGPDRFTLFLIVKYAQRIPQASFAQIEEVSRHFSQITQKCCSHQADGDCFLEERYALHDEVCRDEEALSHLPEVSTCCAMDGRKRIVCFDEIATHANVTVGHEPELCSAELCKRHHEMGHQFRKRVAYEFGRRFPKAAMVQMRVFISKYLSMVDTCCDAMDDFRDEVKEAEGRAHALCEDAHRLSQDKLAHRILVRLAQRIPDASFENATSVATHFAIVSKKCCDEDHEKTCFMEEEFSLEEQLCVETESLSHLPSVAKCCQLAPYERSECMARLGRHSHAATEAPPTVGSECANHSHSDRILFEFARRFPDVGTSKIFSLAHHYEHHAKDCCAKPEAEIAACLSHARKETKLEAGQELQRTERICETLKSIGAEKYEDRLVISVSQKAPSASFDQVTQLTRRLLRSAVHCCGQPQRAGCFIGHRHALQEAICSAPPDSLPAGVSHCCSVSPKEGLIAHRHNGKEEHHDDSEGPEDDEARSKCFEGLQGNVTKLPHSPFYSNAKICRLRASSPHKFLDRFLWEFSRRHPRAAESQIEELSERFAQMADSCCGKIDSDSCFTTKRHDILMEIKHAYSEVQKVCGSLHLRGEEAFIQRDIVLLSQKAPQASFEKIAQLAKHLQGLATKCCAPDHVAGCFLEERYAIHDEICHDGEILSKVPKLEKCCKLIGKPRADCMDEIPTDAEVKHDAMPVADEGQLCQQKAAEPTLLAERIMYEFGRRFTDASVGEVNKLARTYLKGVNECCALEKTQDCFVEKRAALEKTIKDELTKAHVVCETLHKEGVDHYEELVMVHFTKDIPTLSFDLVEEFAHRFVGFASHCCSGSHEPRCLLDESLHLQNELCSHEGYAAAHPGAAICCRAESSSEAGSCFERHEETHRTELAASVSPIEQRGVLLTPEEVCLAFRQFPEKFPHRALYQFAQRFRTSESTDIRMKAEKYAKFTESCCRAADKTACFTEKVKELH